MIGQTTQRLALKLYWDISLAHISNSNDCLMVMCCQHTKWLAKSQGNAVIASFLLSCSSPSYRLPSFILTLKKFALLGFILFCSMLTLDLHFYYCKCSFELNSLSIYAVVDTKSFNKISNLRGHLLEISSVPTKVLQYLLNIHIRRGLQYII